MSLRGWDTAAAASQYRAFEHRHGRYRLANAALARHAALRPDLRILDLAAGTGGTTAALLPLLGPAARVDCVEPAKAMAQAGRMRLGPDPRVRWLKSLHDAAAPYDRIVCGAAIWQWPDLRSLLRQLASLLAPGGALVFNIPGAYLGVPDGPGGGSDPWLTALMAELAARHPPAQRTAPPSALPSPGLLDTWLVDAGLQPQRWHHRQRLRQPAWCDWWSLPALTQALWPGVSAAERTLRVQAAAAGMDRASWRPENWLGWTAFKPAFEVQPLPDSTALLEHPAALRRRAARDGALLLRGQLPRATVARLRQALVGAARAEGLIDARGNWAGGAAAAAHEVPGWIGLQQRMALRPDFQALVQAPELLRVVALLGRGSVQGGLGSICRVAPPEHRVPATPAHRDAQYLQATEGVWGAWIPLSGCRVAEGGLAVAPGSQRGGAAARWAAADLQPGDLLLLSAQTLHRGCPNFHPRRPRLSIDLRFGPSGN